MICLSWPQEPQRLPNATEPIGRDNYGLIIITGQHLDSTFSRNNHVQEPSSG